MSSRWFYVPVTLTVVVKVPMTSNIDVDREEAHGIAQTLVNKRIKECSWGGSNPWTASIHGIKEVGYPEHQPTGGSWTADDEEFDDDEEDDDADEE